MDELNKRLDSDDEFEILGISAVVRKLLYDDFPLIDQVNRKYKEKIIYEVSSSSRNPSNTTDLVAYSLQDGLDPETSPSKYTDPLKRDQFSKIIIAIVAPKTFTLKDIVLFEANIMGGIHAGSSTKDKEKVLEAFNSTTSIGGYRPSLRQLKSIDRVIHKAHDSLYEKVKSDTTGES